MFAHVKRTGMYMLCYHAAMNDMVAKTLHCTHTQTHTHTSISSQRQHKLENTQYPVDIMNTSCVDTRVTTPRTSSTRAQQLVPCTRWREAFGCAVEASRGGNMTLTLPASPTGIFTLMHCAAAHFPPTRTHPEHKSPRRHTHTRALTLSRALRHARTLTACWLCDARRRTSCCVATPPGYRHTHHTPEAFDFCACTGIW